MLSTQRAKTIVLIVPPKAEYDLLWWPWLDGTNSVETTLYLCGHGEYESWIWTIIYSLTDALPDGSEIIDHSQGVSNFFVSVKDFDINEDKGLHYLHQYNVG